MSFDLKSIQRGAQLKPPRIVVMGVEGCGKTTFAAGAPKAIFLCTEDGLGSLDAARFPMVEQVDDVRQAISTLYETEHDFETLVLDSADHLELLITQEIERKFDEKALAYGKAAIKAAEVWQELLGGFNALRNEKGMSIILIAHVQIKRFDSPETEPYDRFQLKLQERSSSYIREWCDALLFANYKTIIKKADVGFGKEVARGITNGERLLFTSETPAYQAKNRYGLPSSLPLDWQSLENAIAGREQAQQKKAA